MAQAPSRRVGGTPARRTAQTDEPDKAAKQAEKDSAEQQQKPMSAKAHAKAQEDFDPNERIVQRSSYNDGASQRTRYDGDYQYDQHPSEK
jgi:hypothetical protein